MARSGRGRAPGLTAAPGALPPQGEVLAAFRQAQCPHNAWAHANAGMRVLLQAGTDTIEDLSIAFGGLGAATVIARRSCQQLQGR